MDTHEAARRRIYERARDTWDEDTAEALMTALPSTVDLATKHDIEMVKQDVEMVRQDMVLVKQDVELVKQDLVLVKQDMVLIRHDIELLRKDVDLSGQRLAAELHAALASTMKALFFGLSGMMISLAIATNLFD